MKRAFDISEALGTVDTADGSCELCASSESGYDETTGRLVANLDAFLRTTSLRAKERQFRPDWLPQPEIVTERVKQQDADEVVRDIFRRWVRKVREAAPALQRV